MAANSINGPYSPPLLPESPPPAYREIISPENSGDEGPASAPTLEKELRTREEELALRERQLLAREQELRLRETLLKQEGQATAKKGKDPTAPSTTTEHHDHKTVSPKEHSDEFPLHQAAALGYRDVLAVLIGDGLDVNAKNHKGNVRFMRLLKMGMSRLSKHSLRLFLMRPCNLFIWLLEMEMWKP